MMETRVLATSLKPAVMFGGRSAHCGGRSEHLNSVASVLAALFML